MPVTPWSCRPRWVIPPCSRGRASSPSCWGCLREETTPTSRVSSLAARSSRACGPSPLLRRTSVRQLGRPARRRPRHLLAEAIAPDDSRWELQLKGPAHALLPLWDGRAVLRSSIREFVCSEAMHHPACPLRAPCRWSPPGQVVRDMFYDGHPRPEPGRGLSRRPQPFLGARDSHHAAISTRRVLLDHILRRHSPHLLPTSSVAPARRPRRTRPTRHRGSRRSARPRR